MDDLPEIEFSIWCEDQQRVVPCVVIPTNGPAAKENDGLAVLDQACFAALFSLGGRDLFAKMTVRDLMDSLDDVIYAFVPKDFSDDLETIPSIAIQ